MNDANCCSKYISNVRRKLWITIGSRFNASRRLNNRYNFSAISISILSIFGIGTPIVQNHIDLDKCSSSNELYSLFSILLSIFILVLSLLEGTQNYQVRSEKLHSNAVEMSSIQKEIDFLADYELPTCAKDDCQIKVVKKIKQHYKEYDDLIKRCPENHDTDDLLLFKAQNYKEFKDDFFLFKDQNCKKSELQWLWSKIISIYFSVKYYWMYFLLMATIAIIISSLYFSCPILR